MNMIPDNGRHFGLLIVLVAALKPVCDARRQSSRRASTILSRKPCPAAAILSRWLKPFLFRMIVDGRRAPYSGGRDKSRTGNARMAFFMRGAAIAGAAG